MSTGPLTSVTSAPRSIACRAMAYPMRPVERLVRKRTGSSASRVGPADTTMRMPARSFTRTLARTAQSTSSSTEGSFPSPSSPQASMPEAGGMTTMPLDASASRFACVAALRYMCTFMAGATSTRARSMRDATYDTQPASTACARCATVLAEAGATIMRSASRASASRTDSRPVAAPTTTWWRDSTSSVRSDMKRAAASVMSTRTSHPSFTRRDVRSAAL